MQAINRYFFDKNTLHLHTQLPIPSKLELYSNNIGKAIFILFTLLALFNSEFLYSQELKSKDLFELNTTGGVSLNVFRSDFNTLTGIPDTFSFKSGFGTGVFFSLGIDMPIDKKSSMGLSLLYTDRSGMLTSNSNFYSRDTVSMQPQILKTQKQLNAVLRYFEIMPVLKQTLKENFISGPLKLTAGLRLGILLDNHYDYKEIINDPDNAVFIINGVRTNERNAVSGTFDKINKLSLGISSSLENSLKIGDGWNFTQTLALDYNFTNVLRDVSWNTFALRIGVGLQWCKTIQLKPEIQKYVPPVVRDTPRVMAEKPVPQPKVKISFVRNDIEIYTGNELLASSPMVNDIFFRANSDKIDPELLTSTNVIYYSLNDPLKGYKYTLFRIAALFKDNPKASLILKGATSGAENEPEGIALARRRAVAVQEALISIGVLEDKITINAFQLPENPSNQDFPEGIEENQRVDIIVKNAPLQEYVSKAKFSELNGSVQIDVNIENVPMKQLPVKLMSDFADTVISARASGIYTIPVKLRFNREEKLNYTLKIAAILKDSVVATDSSILVINNLPVKIKELDLSGFNAILRFDYNSSQLTEDNKELLRQMCNFLPEGSTIMITGSSDALGSESRNNFLESERARVSGEFIKSVCSSKLEIRTGSQKLKFDESKPWGRFLNRSITVRLLEE
jgi:outer membrane protein OmpA-like peptidoglycan-associated protein